MLQKNAEYINVKRQVMQNNVYYFNSKQARLPLIPHQALKIYKNLMKI